MQIIPQSKGVLNSPQTQTPSQHKHDAQTTQPPRCTSDGRITTDSDQPLFLLGTHHPNWLSTSTVPLFISDRRLKNYRHLPKANVPWALDSGAFTELATHGNWNHGPAPKEYASRVRRYHQEIGKLLWAAPQDWMVEPFILAKTKLTVAGHQRRTVENFKTLRQLAPDLPVIPVIQGWEVQDYVNCVALYQHAGIDLTAEPLVGVGSICRRQGSSYTGLILRALHELGITRLHGFGVKKQGLLRYGHLLTSADSLAWSFAARRSPRLPTCTKQHRTCANCPTYAYRWRNRLVCQLNKSTKRAELPARSGWNCLSRPRTNPNTEGVARLRWEAQP